MCVVSMTGDYFSDKWKNNPSINWPNVNNLPNSSMTYPQIDPGVTKQEFEQLKKEVLEMKELLKRSIEYDKKNNEPHCEIAEKIITIKQIANLLGVDLNDLDLK